MLCHCKSLFITVSIILRKGVQKREIEGRSSGYADSDPGKSNLHMLRMLVRMQNPEHNFATGQDSVVGIRLRGRTVIAGKHANPAEIEAV